MAGVAQIKEFQSQPSFGCTSFTINPPMAIPVIPNRCVCKITISETWSYHQVARTIYYRSGMSPDFVVRWRWYFDYLAALVKVRNPHQNVIIYCGPLDDEIKLGKEWHEYRRGVMLRTCRKKLTELAAMQVEGDLFGLGRSERDAEVAKWTAKLEALEADSYPIPDFPEYINLIKKFL